MRWGILTAISFLAFGIGAFLGPSLARHLSAERQIRQKPTAEANLREIHMVFVGDIMLSRSIEEIMARKKDYRFPLLKIASTTESADIAFANLENPISSRGVKSGSIYSFRADPKTLEGLIYAGFDVVSVANNHIWDYGKQAFKDTLANLSSGGIVVVGGGESYDAAHMPKIIAVGDTRIAFLAYSNLLPVSLGLASSTPAVSRYSDDTLKEDVARAKEISDFVIVSFHWGEEYKTKHNAEQERIAKLAIDAGANLVIGHHPHVVQEIEEYKGAYIAYSLGNFIFDQNFSKDTRRGLVLLVTVKGDKIISIGSRKVAFTDDYQPYFVEGMHLE